MLEFYIMRHGESELNTHPEIIGGRTNESPLSHLGIIQAKLLGKRLKKEGVIFDRVYSSTAVRAYQTAELATRFIGFPAEEIVQSPELVELDQGIWEGKLRKEIYTPEVLARIKADNWNFKEHGGESQRDVEERIYGWIDRELIGKLDKGKIGIFNHGMAIKCLLRKLMNFDPRTTYYLDIENTSITRLDYNQELWRVRGINDFAHLK